jgi:branched-chain amino acid transport system substrate-binding protein
VRIRERIAIGFITASVLATVGLGAAAGFALARGSAPRLVATQGGVLGSTSGAQATPTPTASPGAGASSAGPGGTSQGAATAASTQNFVHNGVLTVGGIYDEQGPVDATVERDTVRAYFDQVNAAGGVNGYKLQLLDCDSAWDTSKAHACSEQLISQGILAIVGWTSVSGEQPETSYLTKNGIPIFGGLGVDAEYTTPLSFPVGPPLGRGGYATGLRACQLGLKNPGIVYLQANFAASLNAGILAGLKTCGITPTDDQGVDIANQQDYTTVVTPMREHGDQSVIGALDPFSYGRLFQAMERQQYNVPVLGGGLDKTSAEAGYGSALNGAYSLVGLEEPVGHTSNPAMADYLNTVRKYYPSQVSAMDTYSEGQWVAAHVFVDALRAIHGPVTRASLIAAAQNLQNVNTGGLTPPLSYARGRNNDPGHAVQWIHNQDGKADGWVTDSGWVTINYTPCYC